MESLKGRRVFGSLEELVARAKPDLIFHTAVSSFRAAFWQIEPMARLGIHVVSSCEELVYPRLRQPKLATRLDRVCQAAGARVVGTGVNPGFVMDLLPLFMTGVCRQVRSVRVWRVVDASTRREPLQRKIGSGQSPAKFGRLLARGRAGHAGLRESLALIAHCLGWKPPRIKERAEALVAQHDIRTPYFQVKKGQTCGIHQRVEAAIRGATRLSLDLTMRLDAEEPHDAIRIEGDPPLGLLIQGGVAGDAATVAALVNAAPRLLEAPPGLRLVTDLPAPRIA
jgi:4-hydroxy-tetrahydrodipicolinate reductase